ncbi:MAG: transketolase [Candidatus Marinimicrobia bacterium]|nr:transketolase [Candidatus Neomarinimicrobiota bacterium]
MRNAFAAELTRLAQADDRIVLLSGDIGNRLFDPFKAACPARFRNCGVAEANMIGVGAGLALSGLRPVAYTITPFLTTRCLEQIKLDVCYHAAPLVIVAVGAGLSYANLGPTHHSFEDLAILRTLPGLAIVCPADPLETAAALRAALAHPGPVYLRLGKKGEPAVYEAPPDFAIGRAITLREGADGVILCCGTLMPNALAAAELLAGRGLAVGVINMHTVKPLDTDCLGRVFADARWVVTLEEHGLIGGFGGAVAEWLADQVPYPARLLRCGIPDRFIHEAGDQTYARQKAGLDPAGLAERIEAFSRAVAARETA